MNWLKRLFDKPPPPIVEAEPLPPYDPPVTDALSRRLDKLDRDIEATQNIALAEFRLVRRRARDG